MSNILPMLFLTFSAVVLTIPFYFLFEGHL